MIYNNGVGNDKGWILKEETFPYKALGKCESIMCLGNGYMGIRASMEEYTNELSRRMLIAGTFDFMKGDIATELPNAPDVTNMVITVDGKKITPKKSQAYERTLNLKNGLLRRYYIFETADSKKIELEFLRVVSLRDLHLISQKVNIKTTADCRIGILSGIDGNVSGGLGHFSPINAVEKDGILQVVSKTRESKIMFSIMSTHKYYINGVEEKTSAVKTWKKTDYDIKEKKVFSLKAGDTLSVTKTSNVFTNRDKELDGCRKPVMIKTAFQHMLDNREFSFEEILSASAKEWERKIWSYRDVKIESENESDQLAIRFAIYHLTIMSPVHDNRMNIGAKGLSGPGYRGHTFWDTEVFMLPYFIFSAPNEAISLLQHRYNSIDAARRNAKERGFKGAMYPWESAWITDGEVTPPFARSGLMEHHITAAVATGVYYYYIVTGDETFMEDYGYEMLFDTAVFWASRFEYNRTKDIYEILHVIGPDEYKEDVNNNAYTNYLAHYNIVLAIKYADKLKKEKPDVYKRLNNVIGIEKVYKKWMDVSKKAYLPKINNDGLLPQDDTYLSLIDITEKESTVSENPVRTYKLMHKYGIENVMVSKQADVMLLMFLFEDFFTAEIKKNNFYYYEKRCTHESSLSLSTYSAIAADLGEKEAAYKLYQRASMIDMGDMYSSDEGIHSASLGGVWQCTMLGFGGVRRYGEQLRIQPNLPDSWNMIEGSIVWKGQRLALGITKNEVDIKNLTASSNVEVLINGKVHKFFDSITVKYNWGN